MRDLLGRGRVVLVGVVAIVLVVVGTVTTVLVAQRNNAPSTPPVARATATAARSPTPAGTPTLAPLPDGNDWPQYRSDVYGTGINSEQSITSANVAQLQQRWAATRSQGYFSTPAIVGGVVYVTTGLSLYAYDLRTGKALWHFDAPSEKHGGIHSSVAIDTANKLAFFATPDTNFYAVDLTTHKQRWHAKLGEPSNGAFGWSSPLVVNNKVYIGLASNNDNPCVRGAVFAFDAKTGKQSWVHYTEKAGATGAGVWSSVTAIPEAKAIIATTGNPCSTHTSDDEQDAIVAIDWNTGKTLWKYTALAYDDCDCDFGEGAVNFTYQGNIYVVAGNKYGVEYALRLDSKGRNPHLVWSRRIAIEDNGKNLGGIYVPPAYSNGLIYVIGGAAPDHSCPAGVLYALQAATGNVAWKACTHGFGHVYSAPAVVGDVVITAENSQIVAHEQTTGTTLWTSGSKTAWGGAAISHGYLVVPLVTGQLVTYALPPTT